MEPLYEEYIERILVAFYKAHQDPQHAGVRAHGLLGMILAVDAGIVSTDEWQAKGFWTSQKRWDIVAALQELIDRDYIKRTEDDTEVNSYPDRWNFRLTPQGKEYAHQLLSKDRENGSTSTKGADLTKSRRIFISSTWEDLQPEREAVEKALNRMRDAAFAGMEYFGSRPETPREASLIEVDRSHIYIGIFAHRYGSGITEAEYQRAQERGIPCLIYFKDESVPVVPAYMERDPEKGAKLEALKRDLKDHHIVSIFNSPDHLATQVVADLHNLLGSTSQVKEEKLPQTGPKYQINITDSQGIVIGDQKPTLQILEQGHTEADVQLVPPGEDLYEWGVDHYNGPIPNAILLFLNFYLMNIGNAPGSLEKVVIHDATTEPRGLVSLQYRGLYTGFRAGFRAPKPLKGMEMPVPVSPGDRKPVSCYFKMSVNDNEPRAFAKRLADLSKFSITLSVSSFGQCSPLLPKEITTQGDFGALKQGISGHWRTHGWDELIHIVEGGSLQSPFRNTERSEPDIIRLQHLADNIRQDLALLKDYEDALRYEDDPRRRTKYRREIEQLRESAAGYQREYDTLRAQFSGEPSAAMQDVAAQLQQMDAKLNALLTGQAAIRDELGGLRQAMLARFEAGEQAIIEAVVNRLDQGQLAMVQAVLDAIEAEKIPASELQEALTAVQHTLSEIREQGLALSDHVLASQAEHLSEMVDVPKLDLKHKLKVTLPIIPLILSYEGDVELGSGLDLEAAWQRLMARVRGKQ